MTDDFASGYRQAALDAHMMLCTCEHMGDARGSMENLWAAAGLAGERAPTVEDSYEYDADALVAMGARRWPKPVEQGRESKLLDLVCYMASAWPDVGSFEDMDALAGILGVVMVEDGDRMKPDPESLPKWYENPYNEV